MNDLSIWSLEHFQMALLYGVAVLILYIIVPTALLANELRLAMLNNYMGGNHSIFTHIFKAVFFIVMWLLFVTLIAILVEGASGHTKTGLSFGVDSLFHIDWLHQDMSKINTNGVMNNTEKEEAKFIVLMLSWAKFIEIVSLGMMMALTLGLLFGAKISKMKRDNEELDFATAVMILAIALLGFGMFHLEIRMIDIFLTDIIHWGNTFNHYSPIKSEVYIYDDFWSFLRKGLEIAINKQN